MKKSVSMRCIATDKAVSAGDEEENGGPQGGVGGAGVSSGSTSPLTSLQATMQGAEQELQRFTLYRGIDAAANHDDSTGDDELSWWSWHQFAYPTLAGFAKKH